MNSIETKSLSPIAWDSTSSTVKIIDQRLLPHELKWLTIKTPHEMAQAIRDMALRGAPLIGIAAAYGMAMAAEQGLDLCATDALLRKTRPTAVNLMWALNQIQAVIQGLTLTSRDELASKILQKAIWIHQDDYKRCQSMSEVGANYIKAKFTNKIAQGHKLTVLTHCNAGALATGGYGTALGVIRKLHEENLIAMVYSDETRPRQQGSRLTAWELAYEGIPVTMLCDNMAAHCMKSQMIDFVVVGADRIAANGDAANKIGTLQVAISAKFFDVPFYVAAPESTVDKSISNGSQIPIEERDASEVHTINGELVTAKSGVQFFNPGFDVTPSELIEAIFTENGLFNKTCS